MVGEAWSQIMVSGSKYQDMHKPHVGVQVGRPGSVGLVEITDIVFTTRGPGKLRKSVGEFELIPVFSSWRNCCGVEY